MTPVRLVEFLAPHAVGGIETMVETLATGLSSSDFELRVIAMVPADGPGTRWVHRLREHRLGVDVIPATARPWRDAEAFRALVSTWRPDVVHSHGYRADILTAWSRLPPQCRRVATVHGFTPTDWKSRWYSRLDRLALRRFDEVVAVAATVERRLVRSGVAPTRVRVLHNGVALPPAGGPKAALRQHLGLPREATVLGTVGRLSPEKGHQDLLLAFQSVALTHPETVLAVVGDGSCRQNLVALAERAALAHRIFFLGEHRDIGVVYPTFDLFVLPSHTEACPTALIEALGYGIPVVATRVGAVPDMIEDGTEGVLVDPRNPTALAAGLHRALGWAPRWETMATAARLHYAREYTAERWVSRMAEVLARGQRPALYERAGAAR